MLVASSGRTQGSHLCTQGDLQLPSWHQRWWLSCSQVCRHYLLVYRSIFIRLQPDYVLGACVWRLSRAPCLSQSVGSIFFRWLLHSGRRPASSRYTAGWDQLHELQPKVACREGFYLLWGSPLYRGASRPSYNSCRRRSQDWTLSARLPFRQ